MPSHSDGPGIWLSVWRFLLTHCFVWASSGGSGETARMRRLAWTFAARIGDKYQIRFTRPRCWLHNKHLSWKHATSLCKNCQTVWQIRKIFILSCRKLQSVWQRSCNPSQKSNFNSRHVLWNLNIGYLTHGFGAKGPLFMAFGHSSQLMNKMLWQTEAELFFCSADFRSVLQEISVCLTNVL